MLDFPIHLTRINIAREISNISLDYGTYYRFSWHPTYCFFDLLTYLLSFVFGVFSAAKIVLSLYLLLALTATRYVLKSTGAPLFPFILWPGLFTYNWWFWIGSINLLAGFCFGIYAVGLTWKHRKQWGAFQPLKLLMLLILSAACHPISVMLSLMVIVPIVISSRFNRRYSILCNTVFVLVVIALEILAHWYFHQPWELLKNLGRAQWLLHDFYAPGSQARVFKIAFLAVFFLWLFNKKQGYVRFFFIPAFLVLLVVITPHSIGISGDNDLRCSFFAILLVPFFVPSPSQKTWTILVSAVFLCCGVYWNMEQVKKQIKYRDTYLEIEQIAKMAPNAPRVRPLCANVGMPDQQAAVYITFFRGGFTPFMFASPFHGLTYLKRPQCEHAESFEKLDADCADFYNFVVVYKNEGYKPVTTDSSLVTMGFTRCFAGKHFDCYLKK